MDYVREVHAFFNELEINPLSSSAIALWHALLHMQSRCGSKDKFSVPVGTLSLKSGLSDRSVSNARNELKTKGFLEFQSRGGNKAATYQIKLLSANIADNLSGKASDNLSDKVSDNLSDKPSALKDFKDLNHSSSASSGAYESFYAAHLRVFGFECNPFQANQLAVYIDQDGMQEAVVVRAIERAALASKGYRFNLITKILDDYFRSGVKTIEAAIAADERFENGKNPGNKPNHLRSFDLLDQIVEEDQVGKSGRIGAAEADQTGISHVSDPLGT